MLEDVECPYCGEWCEIRPDNCGDYDESETYAQQCSHCGKTFAFMLQHSLSYEAHKADCLNEGGEHEYIPTFTYPVIATKMECKLCGERRAPTEAEMKEIKEARDE